MSENVKKKKIYCIFWYFFGKSRLSRDPELFEPMIVQFRQKFIVFSQDLILRYIWSPSCSWLDFKILQKIKIICRKKSIDPELQWVDICDLKNKFKVDEKVSRKKNLSWLLHNASSSYWKRHIQLIIFESSQDYQDIVEMALLFFQIFAFDT